MSRRKRNSLLTDFVKKFAEGKLGRKRQHGNRYVVDCDRCQILMLKTGEDTEQILGINFGSGFSIFESLSYTYTNSRGGDLGEYSPENLIGIGSKLENRDITTSFLIDSKDIWTEELVSTSRLFDLAGRLYLLDHYVHNMSISAVDYINYIGDTDCIISKPRVVKTFKHVPQRVKTIEDARAVLMPNFVQENMLTSQFVNGYWLSEMPDDFKPPQISDEEFNILINPPINVELVSPFMEDRNINIENYINSSKNEELIYNDTVRKCQKMLDLDSGTITGLTFGEKFEVRSANNETYVKGNYLLYNYNFNSTWATTCAISCKKWNKLFLPPRLET